MGFNASGVKVEETGLSVRYSIEQRTEQVTNSEGETSSITLYVVRRRIKKRYAYVGLSLAGARSLSDQKIAKYTREHLNGNVNKLACQADIIISRGDAWYRLDIDVNEEDIAISEDSVRDPSAFFPAVNPSDYDEDIRPTLSIDSWSLGSLGLTGKWSILMSDSDPRRLMCQWKKTPEEAWNTVTSRTDFDCSSTTFYFYRATIRRPCYFRLAYGDIFSDVIYVE